MPASSGRRSRSRGCVVVEKIVKPFATSDEARAALDTSRTEAEGLIGGPVQQLSSMTDPVHPAKPGNPITYNLITTWGPAPEPAPQTGVRLK